MPIVPLSLVSQVGLLKHFLTYGRRFCCLGQITDGLGAVSTLYVAFIDRHFPYANSVSSFAHPKEEM